MSTLYPRSISRIPSDYSRVDTAAEFRRSCPRPIESVLVKREVIEAVNGIFERRFSSMNYDECLVSLPEHLIKRT
jgi:hypothetical protein